MQATDTLDFTEEEIRLMLDNLDSYSVEEQAEIDKIADHVNKTRIKGSVSKAKEIRKMLKKGMYVTINSDDPAYFRAYLSDNLQALADDDHFTADEIIMLIRNSFLASWLPDFLKRPYLMRIDQITRKFFTIAGAA